MYILLPHSLDTLYVKVSYLVAHGTLISVSSVFPLMSNMALFGFEVA